MIGSTGGRSAKPSGSDPEGTQLHGLQNRGHDCFLCATLQILAHDAPLRDYLLAATPADDSLGAALKDVLVQLQSHGAEAVDPRGVRDTLGRTAPQFAGRGPGDASEVFAWLLSGLHDELRVPSCTSPQPVYLTAEAIGATERTLDDGATHDDAWLTYCQANSTKIAELHHGMQLTTSVCLECHRRSDEFSPFSTISLSLPSDRSGEGSSLDLQCCISGWCEPAAKPTVVFCSHCDDFRQGTQHRTISRLPPCLTFHIQRLDEDALRTVVTCPLVLSSEILYGAVSTDSGDGGASGHATNAAQTREYELHAATHVAFDCGAGTNHYYSCCKQVCRQTGLRLPWLTLGSSCCFMLQNGEQRRWLCFDDENVRAVDEQHASSGIVHMACYRLKTSRDR